MQNTAAAVLNTLADEYGTLEPDFPTEPYPFLIWWYCGYPQSQKACAKGWASLTSAMEVEAEILLRANPVQLAECLRAGGMVPELRAMRIKEASERVVKEFGGDLGVGLRGMPAKQARAALMKFPSIASPGADRILLFAGIEPAAAVPSNCVHVLDRIERGGEGENYGVSYRRGQQALAAATPVTLDARRQAYLRLRKHGQDICKRTNPKCSDCVVRLNCRYFAGRTATDC